MPKAFWEGCAGAGSDSVPAAGAAGSIGVVHDGGGSAHRRRLSFAPALQEAKPSP